MQVRNPIAASLRSGHLRPQAVRPKKGKGSYTRKGKGK
jgi:stalled ribosome alternative rescue factor ArfA